MPPRALFWTTSLEYFSERLVLLCQKDYCQLSMYADDHQLYLSGAQISEVESVETILNDQAQVAANWY